MARYYIRFRKLRWQLWKYGQTTDAGQRLADEYIDSYITRLAAEAAKATAENDARGGGLGGWIEGTIGEGWLR